MGSPITNSAPDACEVCVPLLSSYGELEASTGTPSKPDDYDKNKQGSLEWFQQRIASRPTFIFIRTVLFIIGLVSKFSVPFSSHLLVSWYHCCHDT